jgi:omega-6 fatty acid desaturase (delta-12 desaturase)|tara:strand:- start:16388 stop:17509 length:1122 start_codon:yes stop_codon:yes gene_type:complete
VTIITDSDPSSKTSVLTTTEIQSARKSSYIWGFGFLFFDGFIYLAALYGAMISRNWWESIVYAVIAGFCTSGLLIIAHDACHQSLTPHRKLNRIIGTIAFLPALHAYSLWRHGHNFMHHLHTNQRGLDYVWEPLSLSEFRQLSGWGRIRYRFFRSYPGHYFYYVCEIWWKRRLIPRKRYLGKLKLEYWIDSGLVICWIIGLSTSLILIRSMNLGVSATAATEWPFAIGLGLVMPFMIGEMLMSNTEYMHHTHPRVHWYRTPVTNDWSTHQAQVSVHVRYPKPLDWLVHWIMDHTAHHIQPTIPLYQLENAQQLIDHRVKEVVSYQFSFRELWSIMRMCKLYDDEVGCWTDFKGNPTSAFRRSELKITEGSTAI